jgi:hypothetical protein
MSNTDVLIPWAPPDIVSGEPVPRPDWHGKASHRDLTGAGVPRRKLTKRTVKDENCQRGQRYGLKMRRQLADKLFDVWLFSRARRRRKYEDDLIDSFRAMVAAHKFGSLIHDSGAMRAIANHSFRPRGPVLVPRAELETSYPTAFPEGERKDCNVSNMKIEFKALPLSFADFGREVKIQIDDVEEENP